MQIQNILRLCQAMSLKRVGLILTIFFSIFVFPPVVNSQKGFTSIDCGGTDNFTDPVTHINWTSDMNLPVVGWNFTLPQANNATSPRGYNVTREMTTVRSFPTGKKNCYELNATKSSKYLLRLRFLYGNFDLLNSGKGYTMKIIIDDTDVTSDVNPTNDIETHEFVLTALSDNISVCLGRIEDPPYINSIELRKLDSHMYDRATKDQILTVYHIYPLCNGSKHIIRYPADPYDRFWQPQHILNATEVNTTMNISDGNSTDKVPLAVMRNAVQTGSFSTSLGLLTTRPGRLEMEWALYFADFNKNEKRRIQIVGYDGDFQVFVGPFDVQFNKTTTILFKSTYIVSPRDKYYRISFYKDGESSEPIMLNAWRYSSIQYRSRQKTDQSDFDVMRDIKKYFNIAKWTGDPCLPINYTWDKVDCVYDGPSARVSSVDLSYMNLNMTLNSTVQGHFQNFTKLDRLRVLNLSNNNLRGELPDSLFKNDLLKIDYSNNFHLRRKVHGLTTIQRNAIIITVVPISTIAMVIVFLIWRHFLGTTPEKRGGLGKQSKETGEQETQSKEKAWRVRWLPPVRNNEHTKEGTTPEKRGGLGTQSKETGEQETQSKERESMASTMVASSKQQ